MVAVSGKIGGTARSLTGDATRHGGELVEFDEAQWRPGRYRSHTLAGAARGLVDGEPQPGSEPGNGVGGAAIEHAVGGAVDRAAIDIERPGLTDVGSSGDAAREAQEVLEHLILRAGT